MRSMELERAWEKRVQRLGQWIEAVGQGLGAKELEGAVLTGINIRLPTPDRPETLLVIKAQKGDKRYVAFCGALELSDALLAWRAKEGARGIKWREDRPWAPGGESPEPREGTR